MSLLHIRIPPVLDEQINLFMEKNADWIPNRSQMVRMAIEHFLESCDHLRKMIGDNNQTIPIIKNVTKPIEKLGSEKEIKSKSKPPLPDANNNESFDVLGDFN